MKPRAPQLSLRLEAAFPATEAQWRAGAEIAWLGGTLTLVLDTASRESMRLTNELHLPLPPAATARQIRDAAESWLRDEALHTFAEIVAKKSALAGRRPVRIVLAFGKRSDWVHAEDGQLRCHWRLIEQPAAVIAQVLGRALDTMQATPVCDDLFSLA
jgi:predicted metal-dependent hydrolase